MLIALKYEGRILLNGDAVTVRARLNSGDVIDLYLEEKAEPRIQPEAIPLEVMYEDTDLLVVNKPAGMIVHPVPPEPRGTLANGIAAYWQQTDSNKPVRIITRLDRDTTGLVLIAQHALAQHWFASQSEVIDKYYLALLGGSPPQSQGEINAPIAIDPNNPVSRRIAPDGRPARTAYRVMQAGAISLVRARLLTGRTHQLRVHFAWLGYPVLGDSQYGEPSPLIGRQALHCYGLRLIHPRTRQELCLLAPLPEDMGRLL